MSESIGPSLWLDQLAAVTRDVHENTFGRAADYPHILSAVDSLRGKDAASIKSHVSKKLEDFKKQARDTVDLNWSLVNPDTGSLPTHLKRIYNHYSGPVTAAKNIVLHQKICREFGFNMWNLGDELNSPMRTGWEPHGPIEPVNAHPSLWPRGQLSTHEKDSPPEKHIRHVRAEIKEKGVDGVLREWADANPISWEAPPPGEADDPELWSEGFEKVAEMIDGVHMELIDDGNGPLPPPPNDESPPLPAVAPPEGYDDDGFFSPIQYVRQRWCPVLKAFQKLRIIGNDFQRNELTSPLIFRLQFRSHREIGFIMAYGLDSNHRDPLAADKADINQDLKRERAARDSGAATTSRWWRVAPKPRRARDKAPAPSVTLTESKVDLLGAYFQNGVKRPWANKQRAWCARTRRWCKLISYCFSFGNRWSCPAFCAVMHPIELLLNSWGIPISFYIDDGIIFAVLGLDDFFVDVVLEVLATFGWAVSTKKGGVIRGRLGEPIDVLGLDHRTYVKQGVPFFEILIPTQKREALRTLIDCLVNDLIEAERASTEKTLELPIIDFQRAVGTLGFYTWNSVARPELTAMKGLWDIFGDWRRCTFKGTKPISFTVTHNESTYMRYCLQTAAERTLGKETCDSFSADDLRREKLLGMTDASKDESKVGLGGVITDGAGMTEVFSIEIKNSFLQSMHIGALEMFAVLLFVIIFYDILKKRNCNVTFLVDNIGAVFSLAKWNCRWLTEAILVGMINVVWWTLNIRVWYTWISTQRNPADDPSRLTGANLRQVVGPEVKITTGAVVEQACLSAIQQFKTAIFAFNPSLLTIDGFPANKRLDPPPVAKKRKRNPFKPNIPRRSTLDLPAHKGPHGKFPSAPDEQAYVTPVKIRPC